jgi:hypothetical protein
VTVAIAIVALAALVGGLYIIRQQAQEIDALRVRAETAETWAEYWERSAEQAAEEAEAACKRHTTLQGLYTRLVREQLAANAWIVLPSTRRKASN